MLDMSKQFIMLVGFPGSGKSTLAKGYQEQGYTIYSTDAIRNEFNLHNPEQISEVLPILNERMIKSLENGECIVYDSTNLLRKHRIKVLELINQYDYTTICYILNTPIDVCKKRNSYRRGYSKISEEDYNFLEKTFQKPIYNEGWDKIIWER